MSRYLIERIEAAPNIELMFNTEVAGLGGTKDASLERVRLRSRLSAEESAFEIRNLFLFVGADPATGWLEGCGVTVDRAGFVVTGAQDDKRKAQAASALETSVPGVFAVGDVRSGSVKRVGGAIGEGAQVVAALHGFLGDTARPALNSVSGWQRSDPALSLKVNAAGRYRMEGKFADVNGIKLHYLIAGRGDPIVLLHGFAETSHMWLPLIAKLSDKHTVIAPDLRGFGQSSAPSDGYTKAAMAQDIHALVKSLKYDRIRLVGHDIGLMVAYAYAAQYPGEVDRLVLMEAFFSARHR